MRNRISRRWFLERLTLGLGVTALGGSLAWWASAPAEPPQRKTPSGDLLETVPRGELPSFAKAGGPQSRGGLPLRGGARGDTPVHPVRVRLRRHRPPA
jgi:hypothetical protein